MERILGIGNVFYHDITVRQQTELDCGHEPRFALRHPNLVHSLAYGSLEFFIGPASQR